MPRNLDTDFAAAIAGGNFSPAIFAMLTFRTVTEYVWTGTGPMTWGGNTFTGVGSLGSVGSVKEGTEINASGTSVTLSGIDPTLLAECMTDIQLGAPAKLWVAAMVDGVIVGAPHLYFSGTVDKAPIQIDPKTMAITLALETKMLNHGRATQRRYTAADQHANGHPLDTAFNLVEQLNDFAIRWGH